MSKSVCDMLGNTHVVTKFLENQDISLPLCAQIPSFIPTDSEIVEVPALINVDIKDEENKKVVGTKVVLNHAKFSKKSYAKKSQTPIQDISSIYGVEEKDVINKLDTLNQIRAFKEADRDFIKYLEKTATYMDAITKRGSLGYPRSNDQVEYHEFRIIAYIQRALNRIPNSQNSISTPFAIVPDWIAPFIISANSVLNVGSARGNYLGNIYGIDFYVDYVSEAVRESGFNENTAQYIYVGLKGELGIDSSLVGSYDIYQPRKVVNPVDAQEVVFSNFRVGYTTTPLDYNTRNYLCEQSERDTSEETSPYLIKISVKDALSTLNDMKK